MLQLQGYQCIAGIDEVGRGALAGPLVVAAVVLPDHCELSGVRDSKLLSLDRREKEAAEIRECGAQIGIGWVHADEIDELGLTLALAKAAIAAIRQLNGEIDMVLLDGKHNYLKEHVQSQSIVGGDRSELTIAAASVIAKVARDRWMRRLHFLYPVYGFDRNVGYGTAGHLMALKTHGSTEWHRQSFGPVQKVLHVN